MDTPGGPAGGPARGAAGVAVVTDSTAYLPAAMAASAGVRVVPMQVVVAGRPFDEGTQISPEEIADALREWRPVTTSRPSPERVLEVYREAAAAGASAVVSVHLSAQMSGTCAAAGLAARAAPLPVRVVDSRSAAMGLGFAVLSAARAAAQGAGPEEVAGVAARRAAATSVLFYVDTLEYLRRGGRIGAAQRLLGQALMVRPLLALADGRVAPLEKVRTASRALARLEELALAAADAAGGPVDVAVQHLAAPERAGRLLGRLRAALPGATVVSGQVGAVLGAHVGPGAVAVVVAPRLEG